MQAFIKKKSFKNSVQICWLVAYTFNPGIWEAGAGGSLELEDSLVFVAISRTARATELDPVCMYAYMRVCVGM